MMRHELALIKGGDVPAAGRASVTQSTAMLVAGKSGCQPPSPPKIGVRVVGEALGAEL
jgi:hypothetical protein